MIRGYRAAGCRSGKQYTSRFKGVCWVEARGKWIAQIKAGDQPRRIGRFDDEEDAARAYDAAAWAAWGVEAYLNFPEEIDPEHPQLRYRSDDRNADRTGAKAA